MLLQDRHRAAVPPVNAMLAALRSVAQRVGPDGLAIFVVIGVIVAMGAMIIVLAGRLL